MKKGYQSNHFKNVLYHAYVQNEGDELIGYSLPYKETKYMKDFVIDGAVAIMNCNFFIHNEWDSNYGTILGRHQGVNSNATTNKDGKLDLVITKDDEILWDDFESWDHQDAKLGITFGAIVMYDGETGVGLSNDYMDRYNNKSERSLFCD